MIADLDVLTDIERVRRVLNALGSNRTDELAAEAHRLVGLVKALPPTISETVARAQILAAMPEDMSWSKEHDTALRTRLQQVSRMLDRMRRFKAAASEPLPDSIRRPLKQLLLEMQSHGLFVVPVGELEEWLAGKGIQASRQNKWAWANEAASLVKGIGAQSGDVWEFMSEVGDHLQSRFTELASQ